MSDLTLQTSRFFLKRKSQIFSAMTFVVPAFILGYGHPEVMLSMLFAAGGAAVSIFVLPRYVRLLLKVEDWINLKLASVSPGRWARMAFHVAWVVGILHLLAAIWKVEIPSAQLTALLVLASGGIHGLAVTLAYKGHGDRNSNVLLAFSLSAWLAALTLVWQPVVYLIQACAIALAWHLISGLLSDLRAVRYPKAGIGVFFGTFNPVHTTHLRIMRDAIESRRLSKIYVHPTTVPKLHRTALASGEIALSYQDGMRVYYKTALADPSKNYFPTGNKFYEYEVRQEILKASLKDAGLEGKVEVLDLPHIYDRDGFFGIVRHVQKSNPGVAVHGLHGSDVGGIWVRHIFDACGWIYPFPVARTDNISATAIRNGATGYTSETVERFLVAARAGQEFQFPSGFRYSPSRLHQSQHRMQS
jgi:hypothetical protein